LGAKRRAVERLPCALCGQAGYSPCISRTTGKPMKSSHMPRRVAGKSDHLAATLPRDAVFGEDFWLWVHRFFGLPESSYERKVAPAEWAALYQEHPEMDSTNQYHGEF
jgi:hypothetical protein